MEHRVGLVYDLDRRPRAILPPAPLPSPVLLARGIRTKKGDGSYRNRTGSVAVFCLICAALASTLRTAAVASVVFHSKYCTGS